MPPSRKSTGDVHRIGVISDTHGLLRPQALAALHGCELLLHAGDIGGPEVLQQLRLLARLIAVRGNNDHGTWAEALPERTSLEVGGVVVHMLHDRSQLDLDPVAAGIRVVVSGHSHRPGIEERAGVLYLNPGSAGPRRFRLPVAVATLEVAAGRVRAVIAELEV